MIGYPPFLYNKDSRPIDMPVTVTNVPHFTFDGINDTVAFKTNSCSTSLAGFYDKAAKKGFFILTEQNTEQGNNGLILNII